MLGTKSRRTAPVKLVMITGLLLAAFSLAILE